MSGLESAFSQLDVFEPYGLNGLDPKAKIYRVCREDEDLTEDIRSKATSEKDEEIDTVNRHLNRGSERKSRYISTTASKAVALEWAFYTKEDKQNIKERKSANPIIEIDLSKIKQEQEATLINLTNEKAFNHFVSGATQINRAKSSQEIIFQWCIPREMFSELKNPPRPPPPK